MSGQYIETAQSHIFVAAERRRFERVEIPVSARLPVWDVNGTPIGFVREVSRGGMRVQLGEPDAMIAGEDFVFLVKNRANEACFSCWIRVKRVTEGVAGCEFQQMGAQLATQIGDLMGTYYEFHEQAAAPKVTH